MAISFAATITKHLNKIADVCESHNPDKKHNTGRGFGEVFFWTQVEKLGKAKKEEAWLNLEKNKLVAEDLSGYDPGEYTLNESPSFFASAKVSEPVKRFDGEVLADQLFKRYKVPKPMTKEMIDKAKVPTKPTVTKKVVER